MIEPRLDAGLTAQLTTVTELTGTSAGSALLSVDGQLLVIGDDAHAVTWVDPRSGVQRAQVLAGDGGTLVKLRKPDYEAAATAPDGAVWLFGSGSLSNRWSTVRLSGPAHADATTYDATMLYAALAQHLGGPANIEGALFLRETLRLFHRAVGRRPDAWLDLPSDVLVGGRPRVLDTREIAPVLVDGVAAHLTDAARAADGRIVYLAAAEDSADAVANGPVAGVVVGVIDGASARWTPLLGLEGQVSTRKSEGLVLDQGGGWLVTDRDDPRLPAELCRFRLDGLG